MGVLIKWLFSKVWPRCREPIRDGAVPWDEEEWQALSKLGLSGEGSGFGNPKEEKAV